MQELGNSASSLPDSLGQAREFNLIFKPIYLSLDNGSEILNQPFFKALLNQILYVTKFKGSITGISEAKKSA